MDVEREDPHRRSKRKSGVFSDLLNVALFLVALAGLLAILAVLDPVVKRWISQFLP